MRINAGPVAALVVVVGVTLVARTTSGQAPAGSIAGRIVDPDTGQPIAGVDVGITPSRARTTTDAMGRYVVSGLPDGEHEVAVDPNYLASLPILPATVTIRSGEAVTGIDFAPYLNATLSGRVLDDAGAPVAGAHVFAVSRAFTGPGYGHEEFAIGGLSLFTTAPVTADQAGRYVIRAKSGVAYRVIAHRPHMFDRPVSLASDQPRDRAPSLAAAYHPAASTFDTATAVTLRSREDRRDVDITLRRAPAYCLEATLQLEGRPAAMTFSLEEADIHRLDAWNINRFSARLSGRSDSDGRIRVCDLAPGQYGLTAAVDFPQLQAYPRGTRTFDIVDRDVRGVVVDTRPVVPLVGEIVWDEPPSADDRQALRIRVPPASNLGQSSTGTRGAPVPLPVAPGPDRFGFSLGGTFQYSVVASGLRPPHYVRDITVDAGSGARSVMQQYIDPPVGAASMALRVFIGANGGALTGRVGGPAGRAVENTLVLIVPASATTPLRVAAGLTVTAADRAGSWTAAGLAPGPYLVLATRTSLPGGVILPMGQVVVDKSPEIVDRLLRAFASGQKVDVAPRTTVSIDLTPVMVP